MVQYIKSDLEFILAQIKIAEAHAAGQPLYGPGRPDPDLQSVLGPAHGRRHLQQPAAPGTGAPPTTRSPSLLGTGVPHDHGRSGRPRRHGADAGQLHAGRRQRRPSAPAGPGDVFDPYVRTISNLIVDQTLGNPAAILTALQRAGIVDPADQMTVLGDDHGRLRADRGRVPGGQPDAERRQCRTPPTTAAANPGNPAPQQAAADALAACRRRHSRARRRPTAPLDALLDANGIEMDGANISITNIAPDEGLSAPFNSWFTLFGQFFDHGLDLVDKGGSGTVFIPLQPDDPLYVPGSHTNFMVLTRATVAPAPTASWAPPDDVRPVNTTTAVRRPEPDLHLAPLAPGLPARVRAQRRRRSGRHRQADRRRQRRHGHLGRRQGAGQRHARHPADRPGRRQRAAARAPTSTATSFPAPNGFPQVVIGVGADGIPDDRR